MVDAPFIDIRGSATTNPRPLSQKGDFWLKFRVGDRRRRRAFSTVRHNSRLTCTETQNPKDSPRARPRKPHPPAPFLTRKWFATRKSIQKRAIWRSGTRARPDSLREVGLGRRRTSRETTAQRGRTACEKWHRDKTVHNHQSAKVSLRIRAHGNHSLTRIRRVVVMHAATAGKTADDTASFAWSGRHPLPERLKQIAPAFFAQKGLARIGPMHLQLCLGKPVRQTRVHEVFLARYMPGHFALFACKHHNAHRFTNTAGGQADLAHEQPPQTIPRTWRTTKTARSTNANRAA